MEAVTGVPTPTFKLSYNAKAITASVEQYCASIIYTDNLDGDEADTLEIILEDSTGLWMADWYPDAGATLTASLGYVGGAMLNCGSFEIDDISLDGPPSTMSIKALSAGVMTPMRTINSVGYDNTTLSGMAQTVATRNGWTLVGNIDPIPFVRVTQHHESDLHFLQRIAGDYGYAFNVRGTQLVFYKLSALRGVAPVNSIGPSQVSAYSFRDKLKGTPASSSVAHHDPKSKSLVTYDVPNNNAVVAVPSADSSKKHKRVENASQAKAMAQANMDKSSIENTEGHLSLPGDVSLIAGNNLTITGWGLFNGTYQIKSSRHILSRQAGYVCEVELRRFANSSAVMPTTPASTTIYTVDASGNRVPVPAAARV